METSITQPNPIRTVFRIRDFRLFWVGQSISMLGDQFHNIAMVWLILKLTGDPLALGLILAVGGIPQAVLSLFGGAIIDRYSPRKVMLAADCIRFFLTAIIAVNIYSGTLETWMIIIYAFVAGGIYGIFEPASSSMPPRILSDNDLQPGNLIIQASTQSIAMVGPILAALFISWFFNDQIAIAIMIAIDSITFVFSIVSLYSLQSGREKFLFKNKAGLKAVLNSTREGVVYVIKDHSLFFIFIVFAIASFALSGPVMVGIPYLANTRYPEGVAAFGIILSGYAAGNLLGVFFSSKFPLAGSPSTALSMVFASFGIGMAALGWIYSTGFAAFDLFLMGILNGYISILLLTGLQRNTPKEMLGRVMSTIIFANMALLPFSQAIAGMLLRINVQVLFLNASALMLGLAFFIYYARNRFNINDLMQS